MAHYCWTCGNELYFPVKVGIKVGRQDSCPHCGSDLKVCKNCKNYDPGVHNMCRETTAEFIRRSTGATADILGLERRGYLRAGNFADVVVLDPAAYVPKADYLHPDVLSEGVLYLWVNGTLAVNAGKLTDTLSGRVLSHAPTAGSCRSSR